MTRRRFNSTEYKEDFRDLIKANPELAADSATKLARKKRNADDKVDDAESAAQAVVATVATMFVMAGAGSWQGKMKARRDALIASWEAEGAATVGADINDAPAPWDHERGVGNPCCWGFFPKLLVLPISLAIVAGVASSRRKKNQRIGTLERTATMAAGATMGLVVADVASNVSYKAKVKKLAAAENLPSVKPLAEAS